MAFRSAIPRPGVTGRTRRPTTTGRHRVITARVHPRIHPRTVTDLALNQDLAQDPVLDPVLDLGVRNGAATDHSAVRAG